jgi:hypothetical protein
MGRGIQQQLVSLGQVITVLVVMRKSERLSVLCVQSSLRHSCFEKCVSISHFANLLSFAFLKNHLKRAENLFCELEDFYANFGVSITVY